MGGPAKDPKNAFPLFSSLLVLLLPVLLLSSSPVPPLVSLAFSAFLGCLRFIDFRAGLSAPGEDETLPDDPPVSRMLAHFSLPLPLPLALPLPPLNRGDSKEDLDWNNGKRFFSASVK